MALSGISWDYPGHDKDPDKEHNRLQILAEVKDLADRGFGIADWVEDSIAGDLAERTPEGVNDVVCEYFDRKASTYCQHNMPSTRAMWESGRVTSDVLEIILEDSRKVFGWSIFETRRKLIAAGRRERRKDGSWYIFNKIEKSSAEDFDDDE